MLDIGNNQLVIFIYSSAVKPFFRLYQVIPTFDMAINEMFFERYPDTILEHQIQVRPFNADKTKNMRALNPEGGFCTHQLVMFDDTVWVKLIQIL